jgi:phage terminase large subunit-like protein
MIPTHNSTLSSGVATYLVAADGEQGAEVYSLATTRDQARIVFDDARAMIRQSPGLQDALGVEVLAHAIAVPRSNSTFKALSAEANTLDGLNIHGAIVDEFHAHQTRAVWDVVNTATGARRQALKWIITTAGFNRAGVCYEQREYVTKILDRVVEDDRYFGIIYTMDEGDDWTAESSHRKANPNYGVSVLPEDISTLCRQAQLSAQSQNNFLTKRLNVWVSADTAYFNIRAWDKCRADIKLEDFEGEDCWMGLDLASKRDLTAKTLMFERDGSLYLFGTSYLPEDIIEEKLSSNHAHYAGWARAGHLILTPGNVTDYEWLERDILSDMERFAIKAAVFDPREMTYLHSRLRAAGVSDEVLVEYPVNVANYSDPMKEMDARIVSRRMKHDGNPVLTWCLSNVVAHTDAKDMVFPRKERPDNKIDLITAALGALGWKMRTQPVSGDFGVMLL